VNSVDTDDDGDGVLDADDTDANGDGIADAEQRRPDKECEEREGRNGSSSDDSGTTPRSTPAT
jgi:hypothetical protein